MPRPGHADDVWADDNNTRTNNAEFCFFGNGRPAGSPHDFELVGEVDEDGDAKVYCRRCLRVAALNMETGEFRLV